MPKKGNRVHPAIWLIYLTFYLLWPVAAGHRVELIRCAAVVAVFLPIYMWTIRRDGWRTLPALAGIVVLGVYGCLTNLGATVFFIYAAALGVRLGNSRRAFGWLGAVLAVEGAMAVYIGATAFPGALYYFTSAVIGSVVIGVACIHQEEVERKNDELRQSREEVTRLAQAAERERIARDLHDLLGHTLSLVVLKSQLAGRLLARGDRRAGPEIAEVERIARQALQEVRTAIAGWHGAGLPEEIANAAVACGAAGLRFEGPDAAEPELAGLPPLAAGAMAMALREAVTNVLRHADASRCRVRLAATAELWRLEVEDDGRGLPAAKTAEGGHGLANIRDRVERLGGEASWLAAPGGGTLLRLDLPRHGAAAFEALDRPTGREAA